jgi:anti-sigma factor RsiW
VNSADCDFIDRWLDDWLRGRLSADAARRVEAHLGECQRCRRLEAIVRGAATQVESPGEADNGEAGDDDVLDRVLSRTSGSSCRRAEALLPALVDDELDAASRAIVSSHVEYCANCARLAAALQEAREVLPALAEVEPPLGFTARVLAHTSHAPRRSAVAQWWLRVLARPRASVELAYVGAVLIVVLVGNPVIAFRGAEEHARRLVGSVPMDRIAGELPAKQAAVGFVASAFGAVMDEVGAIGQELSNRWLQAKAIIDSAWDQAVRSVNWVRTLDWKALLRSAEPSAEKTNRAPPPKDAK